MVKHLHQDQVYRGERDAGQIAMSLWLSDEAYRVLVARAQLALFVKADTVKPRGYTDYLRALFHPLREWRDTRPQWLVQRSIVATDASLDAERKRQTFIMTGNARMTGSLFPLWWDPEDVSVRVRRSYRSRDLPLEEMMRVAVTWGITNPRRTEFQFEPHLAAGNVLEAIGRGMLTPTVEPSNPNPSTRRVRRDKHTYKELVW